MGEFFWGWAIFSVLSNTFDDFKSFASSSPECDSMTMELIASLSGGKAVDCIRYHLFDTEAEMRAYVKERFPHPALLDVSESGRTGAIETLRRRALYVDLSPDGGAVGTTPESITANEANEWLKVAGFGQEYIKLANNVWN